MPTIYDNIDNHLLDGLNTMLDGATRADFCVGYFNLRGWGQIADKVQQLQGENGEYCRLLIGMSHTPDSIVQRAYSAKDKKRITNEKANAEKQKQVLNFAKQLTFGCPSTTAEHDLRKLAKQLRSGKTRVKLHARHPLHAKLYLMHRADKTVAITSIIGSSNLTLAGLQKNYELNVDVVEQDAAQKLANWFEERWDDNYNFDITEELADIIENSWAAGAIEPYKIYLKTIYHLSQDAIEGIEQYPLPKEFNKVILKFQRQAVSIAAQMLNKQGGVIIGDVVGLGKTLIASAVAKTFQEDHGDNVLIICPPKLKDMWDDYLYKYKISGETYSHAQTNNLENMRRYKLIIIDESHNFRNRDSKRYAYLRDYIQKNESRVILLTATPYNKAFTDIASQLRLFINPNDDLGIRPESMLAKIGGVMSFISKHPNILASSLSAFEKSEEIDDWRELMRRFMVRRTRSHIEKHFAEYDKDTERYFIHYTNGEKFYFPLRKPRRLIFSSSINHNDDDYAKLYSPDVVDTIGELQLPRYGLTHYLLPDSDKTENKNDLEIIKNLTRAGPRLRGFTRSGLFKRLESSGNAFLTSVHRHIIRNAIFIAAIDNNAAIPIGQITATETDEALEEDDNILYEGDSSDTDAIYDNAQTIYKYLHKELYDKFDWIDSGYFNCKKLRAALQKDINLLQFIYTLTPEWKAERDRKLSALYTLINKTHGNDKILIFSQYKDTVDYLTAELKNKGIEKITSAHGGSDNIMNIVKRFAPRSNDETPNQLNELRVLVATDTLSEGQNLQDAHIVVNYDLPWAIIRLVQRAGRVDRIGQKANTVYCYCAFPEEGIEKIISLRQRLKDRMEENNELIGSDERFFEGDKNTDDLQLRDLYSGTAKLEETDDETDLISRAYGLWQQAEKENPDITEQVKNMPDVMYSAKASDHNGVIAYIKDGRGYDILAHIGNNGDILSQAQAHLLDILECDKNTPAQTPAANHHELVKDGVKHLAKMSHVTGGQLGGPRAVKRRLYNQLGMIIQRAENTPLFPIQKIKNAQQAVLNYPLTEKARDKIKRLLKSNASDEVFKMVVLDLYENDKLSILTTAEEDKEPRIICSMGLIK